MPGWKNKKKQAMEEDEQLVSKRTIYKYNEKKNNLINV